MYVGVVGSRTFKDYKYLSQILDWFRKYLGDFTVVSGGAEGVDSLAVCWANERKLPVPIVYPAFWSDLSHPDAIIKTRKNGQKYDAAAGFRRNQQIVERADILIAFWDGKSKGTQDSIARAEKVGKLVYIFTKRWQNT